MAVDERAQAVVKGTEAEAECADLERLLSELARERDEARKDCDQIRDARARSCGARSLNGLIRNCSFGTRTSCCREFAPSGTKPCERLRISARQRRRHRRTSNGRSSTLARPTRRASQRKPSATRRPPVGTGRARAASPRSEGANTSPPSSFRMSPKPAGKATRRGRPVAPARSTRLPARSAHSAATARRRRRRRPGATTGRPVRVPRTLGPVLGPRGAPRARLVPGALPLGVVVRRREPRHRLSLKHAPRRRRLGARRGPRHALHRRADPTVQPEEPRPARDPDAIGSWSCPSANKALARAARPAQRPAFTVYAIRHSFAAGLRRTGTDVADIQDLYGHTHPSTTMICAPPQLVEH